MTINRVGVMSAAKISGALYAMFGLIFGAIFSVASLLLGNAFGAASGQEDAWIAAAFGIGAVAFLPILYGILGFIFTAIMAALFNLITRMVGGLELEVRP